MQKSLKDVVEKAMTVTVTVDDESPEPAKPMTEIDVDRLVADLEKLASQMGLGTMAASNVVALFKARLRVLEPSHVDEFVDAMHVIVDQYATDQIKEVWVKAVQRLETLKAQMSGTKSLGLSLAVVRANLQSRLDKMASFGPEKAKPALQEIATLVQEAQTFDEFEGIIDAVEPIKSRWFLLSSDLSALQHDLMVLSTQYHSGKEYRFVSRREKRVSKRQAARNLRAMLKPEG